MKFARANAANWLEVLKAPREFEWLRSEMRGRDVAASVANLVFDETPECRKLGLFFFDRLDLTTFPKELIDGLDERRLALAFYESERISLRMSAIARFLIVLIPRMEGASSGLRHELYDELLLQLKNYPGGCRDEFQRRAHDFPILQKAISEIDAYFGQLKRVRESGIVAMEVAGVRQAAELQDRRFGQAVEKSAEEMSVFGKLFKKVRLLYGNQCSAFHEGTLGKSSALKEFSSSVEMPRMEFIDPEGMHLRRYHASARI